VLTLRWGALDGTIAADTDHHPFGTRMHVPDYGWGVVEDRGGAVKGPARIDVYYRERGAALRFGRRRGVAVEVQPPGGGGGGGGGDGGDNVVRR